MEDQKIAKTARVKKKPRVALIDTWTGLLDYCKISDWDIVIVGDGSGSGWNMGVGWSSVLVERLSKARKMFYSGFNCGTIAIGEMLPCIVPLTWYVSHDGPGHERQKLAMQCHNPIKTFVLSDSLSTVQSGNCAAARRAHIELWATIDSFQARGFDIQFRHIPRDTISIHLLVDALSRSARLSMDTVFTNALQTLQKEYPGLPDDLTVYDLNP